MSSTDPASKVTLDTFLDSERSFAAHQDKYERKVSEVIDKIEEEEEIERRQSGARRPSIMDDLLERRNERKASVLSTRSDVLRELTKPLVAPKKYSLTDDQVEQFQDILLNNDHVIQANDTKMDLVISKEKRSSIDSISSTVEEIERKMSINEEMERKRSIHKEFERRKSVSAGGGDERRASVESGNERRGSHASGRIESIHERKLSGEKVNEKSSEKSQGPIERRSSDDSNSRRVSFELDNVDKNGKRTVLSGPRVETTAETSNVKSIVDELNETARRPPRKLKVESGVLDASRRSTSNLMTLTGSEKLRETSPRTSFNEVSPMKQLIHPNNDTARKFDEIVLTSHMPISTMPLMTSPEKKTLVAKARPMSSMEEESLRERARIRLLRQIAEYLETIEGVGSKFNKESFRRVFLNKELLSRLFQAFDQDKDGLLIQEDWIEYLKERLIDEKQIDLAEQLESVAFVLCGEDHISLDKFCQIFQAKGIVDKVFRLVDQDADGLVTPRQIMELLATVSNSRPRSGFDKGNLEWLEQLFRQTVGDEKEICREDFKKILITKNPFFTERVFQIFDKDNSGSISLQEFIDAMHQFAGQSPDDKIKFLFRVYDLDGDGLIQHKELQHVMRACMEENGMQFSEEQIDHLTMALFEDADSENRGAITYESLKNQLEKHGGLLENLSISIDRWLVPPKPKKISNQSRLSQLIALRPYQLTLPYIRNNYVYLGFMFVYLLINAILFASRMYVFRRSNYYVIFARACGQCLNFNCMFVLVLMLRHCITFLRTRGFSVFLPLDQHIYFHKMTGFFIFGYSALHTVMHLLNFSLNVLGDGVINKRGLSLTEWLFTSRPGLFGLINGWANPTGVCLIIILSIMFICSQTFVRKSGSFEVFYWTHLLYVPFWILLILHCPNFWKWVIIPGIIYCCERIFRFTIMRCKRGKTYISSGLLLPSKVTHLVIKRPQHFDFHPGDYVFVNIPAIAQYEWHPFTISSAPEQEGYMWLHIRGVGEWTNRLYDYFEKEQEKLHNIDDPLPTTNTPTASAPSTPAPPSSMGESQNPIKRIHKTLERKFSGKGLGGAGFKSGTPSNGDTNIRGKMVVFKSPHGASGYTNESFCSLPEDFKMDHGGSTESNISNIEGSMESISSMKNLPLHKVVLMSKSPLSKSLSMPDMDNKVKKRQRLLALREYMRSESEKSFDECQMRRARLQSLGLAYLSPQNKSLAQSFRYMRNKPTIIAFKTPSLESCEAKLSALSILTQSDMGDSQSLAEEGRHVTPGKTHHTPMNYPVGKPLEIYLDGPYGAPSSHIFRAQHAVLIGTGIGVTPFASILQSIMHRYWKARHECPRCRHTWVSEIPPTIMHLRKVDFFWINRDQRSFEWFVNLLSQLEIEQAELGGAMERFLDMHMYITSALQKTDMKAVGLQLALDLLHEKEKRDLITGLKTRTNAGRPNWDKVFKHLLDQKKGKVTVFYCGPPQLARILRLKCDQFGFSFRKEVF